MSPTCGIRPAIAPVPEEQVRHLLLAFFLSQTRSDLPLPLFSASLSPSYARSPPVQLSTAHQWPTVRSGSCISDVEEGAEGGRVWGGGGGRALFAEVEIDRAPFNNPRKTQPTLASFFELTYEKSQKQRERPGLAQLGRAHSGCSVLFLHLTIPLHAKGASHKYDGGKKQTNKLVFTGKCLRSS